MIIAGAPTILPFLVSFFSEILKSHYYPENWRKGIITPIHKQGEIDNPDNYRGITINSCLSKLFNLLLTKHLTTFTNDNQILKYNQIGFRKSFRTSDHFITIKTIINKYLKENKKFFEILKKIFAFLILETLATVYGEKHYFINYQCIMLSLRLPNGITQSFSSNIGLKQGCNLSPILFNIFINDLNEIFDKTFRQPAKIQNLTLNNLLYDDDLILVSETSSGLQNCLDRLQEYCDKWRLRMIAFYNHVKTSESPIIIDSLKLSVELNEEGKTSWFTSVKKIAEALGTPIDLLVNSKVLLNKRLNESIERSRHFKKNLYKQGKLLLYTSLKERPGFQNYLNLPNKKLRQDITKLRISAHKFSIETRRFDYRKRTERICPLCCDSIGDEQEQELSS